MNDTQLCPRSSRDRSGCALTALLHAVITAYEAKPHSLLRDLGDHLNLSVAYVDRAIVEAHLGRVLDRSEWAAVCSTFGALDFDDHVGDSGTFRTDWIDALLDKAGVPGRGSPLAGRHSPVVAEQDTQ